MENLKTEWIGFFDFALIFDKNDNRKKPEISYNSEKNEPNPDFFSAKCSTSNSASFETRLSSVAQIMKILEILDFSKKCISTLR